MSGGIAKVGQKVWGMVAFMTFARTVVWILAVCEGKDAVENDVCWRCRRNWSRATEMWMVVRTDGVATLESGWSSESTITDGTEEELEELHKKTKERKI